MSDQPIPNYSYELLSSIVSTLDKRWSATGATCRILELQAQRCKGCPLHYPNSCATYLPEFKSQITYHFPELSI
jgi:hypothetical protein